MDVVVRGGALVAALDLCGMAECADTARKLVAEVENLSRDCADLSEMSVEIANMRDILLRERDEVRAELARLQDRFARATQFTIGDIHPHAICRPVMAEKTDDGYGPHTGDGIPRWAVRCGSGCLEVGTRDKFVCEPLPSSRTGEWLEKHRFKDLDEALAAARAAHGWELRREADRGRG